MRFGSERVENSCKFYCDITRSYDSNAFGLFLEVKKAIGGYTKVGAGYFVFRRNGWVTTHSNTNNIRLDGVFGTIFLRYLDLRRR
jgi:hypothetical protein